MRWRSAAATLLLSAHVVWAADWPLYRGDRAQTGISSDSLPDAPELLWTFRAGEAVKSSAVVQGGTVVVGSDDGKVYALNLADGSLKWSFETGEAVEAPPAIVGDRVLVGSSDAFLYSLSLADGSLQWKYETEDRILGSVNLTQDGRVAVVGSYDYRLHGVDVASGAGVWTYETDNYINGSPAIADGQAVCGGCDGLLHKVDAANGQRVGAVNIDAYIAGSAAVKDGIAYLGHYGNRFVAVDMKKEAVLWEYGVKEFPFFSAPAVSEKQVIFGGRDKSVHAVDRGTGEARWTFRTRGRVDSSPVLAGNRVVVGSEDGRLYLLDSEDGSEVWSYDVGSALVASPAVADSRIVIGAEDGTVYAFGAPIEAVGSDWPRLLGPHHAMISDERSLLKEWEDAGPPLKWERPRGEGYSAPVVSEGRLVYTHRMGDEEVVECLDPESGAPYWEFRYPTNYRDRYGFNGGPRAAPCIDGSDVYTYGAEGLLHCLNMKTGKLLWRRDLSADYRAEQEFFGVGTSPVTYGDWVLVQVGAPGGPTLVALDKQTGETVWGTGDQWGPSYATPVIAKLHGRDKALVFAGGDSRPPTGGLLAIDLERRAVDFAFPWRSTKYESVNASSPVVIGDRVYVSHAIVDKGAMVRVLPDGGVETLWTNRSLGAYWMTPIHHEGYLYGFDGRHAPDSELVCLDAATGEEQWREQPHWEDTFGDRKMTMRIGRGHLLRVDGSYLCLGETGHLLWLDLSPEGCEILQRSWLFAAHESYTPPVLSHGLLYVTQNQRSSDGQTGPRLLCYDLRPVGATAPPLSDSTR